MRHDHHVVLAAGGTGGHVFPAEALAAELSRRGCRLTIITDHRGGAFGGAFEGLETLFISAGGVAGKSMAARLGSIPKLAYGTLQARSLLGRIDPGAVVGFGGYASAPTMLAAVLGGYKTAIHEQNAILGRANRLLASRVGRIATSFESVRGLPATAGDKVICTGMPVRSSVIAMRDKPYPSISGDGRINLLVFGGSQGARILSEVVPQAIGMLDQDLRGRLNIVQQCRQENIDQTREAYARIGVDAELDSFFPDIPERLAASHLLIGRCGASTVAELTAIGRPAIVVPYPHAVDDHQYFNAHSVDEAGAGWLMSENLFTPETLADRLASLFGLPAILEKAAASARAAGKPAATECLADMVFDLMGSGRSEAARVVP